MNTDIDIDLDISIDIEISIMSKNLWMITSSFITKLQKDISNTISESSNCINITFFLRNCNKPL